MQDSKRSSVLVHTRTKHVSEFPVGLNEQALVILKNYITSTGTIVDLSGKIILIIVFENYASMSDTKKIKVLILYFICNILEESKNTLKKGERLSVYREGIYTCFVAVDGIRNKKPTKRKGQILINDKQTK